MALTLVAPQPTIDEAQTLALSLLELVESLQDEASGVRLLRLSEALRFIDDVNIWLTMAGAERD